MTKNNNLNNFNFTIDKNNCAPCKSKNKNKNNFNSCYSLRSLKKIAEAWNSNNSDRIKIENQSRKQLWDNIQKKFSKVCNNDESCWKKQDFIKKLKDVEIEMFTFKPTYPKEWLKNKYTWLNTYDIFYVMKQYEKKFNDFVFLGPIPSDCPTKIHCELSKLDLINMKKNNINKIGIIYNLDVSSGPGTHWVAIFIDNKKNEINYYDSYGSLPTKLISGFIESLVKKYSENNFSSIVIYNDKRHQYGGSECGVYSMNFILERLHNTNMYQISNKDIPDEKMNYLRKLLYNSSEYKEILDKNK